jgi:dihydroceramidase
MTGVGAYFYLVWAIWLRHCLNGRQEEFELRWPSIYSLPEVVSASAYLGPKTSGYLKFLNGHAKKNV